ncbi:hypothetical protein HYV43_05210 [Candidatus Micrarchaeota archaeon]|nr:hypothetical protein [Candidatus Micrarchaeota archaeon]
MSTPIFIAASFFSHIFFFAALHLFPIACTHSFPRTDYFFSWRVSVSVSTTIRAPGGGLPALRRKLKIARTRFATFAAWWRFRFFFLHAAAG